MKAISRWLDRFCYDHPNFGIPELMKYIAVGNVIVFVLDIVTRGYATMMLMVFPQCGAPWTDLAAVHLYSDPLEPL